MTAFLTTLLSDLEALQTWYGALEKMIAWL